ncbi:MAG: DNA-binding response regulator [Bacteroidetes bacterium]|nr:MAG: DNA-binding response regulator [Bacteroidota bacterium]
MEKIRILLVDDHQIILDGVRSLLKGVNNIQVIGDALNGEEALNTLQVLTADLVLMDLDMPKLNGIDATMRIKEEFPHTKVLILTVHNESSLIRNLISIGADGYLLKNSCKEELLDAIYKVQSGEKYFSSEVTLSLMQEDNSRDELLKSDIEFTKRELDVLRLLADGCTNKEIGEKLFISHRTVDTHRTNIMKKVGVNNVAGLISFAIKNNLVE